MKLRVECYAAGKADERPVRFGIREQVRMVEELLDQWYGPNNSFFKLRADDGNLYILRREGSTPEGTWTLESFRELKKQGSRISDGSVT
jgi:hypothetical protein